MTRPTISLCLAAVAGLLIFALSAAPGSVKHALHTQGHLHPWLHLLSFALLAYLLLNATRSLPLKALLAAALYLFGFATEARESHHDGWPIERRDVLTDTAGIVLGFTLSLWRTRTDADPA